MQFWLGAHMPVWLTRTDVPLFVSHRRLAMYKNMPRALGPWALDSGGFSEISMYGEWRTSPDDYVRAVRRYADEVGNLAWAAPQDWMCEPPMLAKTGLTVVAHQQLTIRSYLELRDTGLPFVPVLQGWAIDDYQRHVEMYAKAGVDLAAEPLVGVGTVCRREATSEVHKIIASLAWAKLKLHGFGVKQSGLEMYGDLLASADSMAWSFRARRGKIRLDGCPHETCGNCLRWALQWRKKILTRAQYQPALELGL
jgi:hypothetical protein